MKKKKYIIFARTATIKQSHEVNSIEAQVRTLRELAQRRNLIVQEVITKNSLSLLSPNDPFEQLVERLTEGQAQGVICLRWDRLTRNFEKSLKIYQLMKEKNISVVTPYKTFSKRNALEIQFITGLLTKLERFDHKYHSQLIKRGLRAKRLKG